MALSLPQTLSLPPIEQSIELVNAEIFMFNFVFFLFGKLRHHVINGLLDTSKPGEELLLLLLLMVGVKSKLPLHRRPTSHKLETYIIRETSRH